MIDIWLLFNLTIPFAEVAIHFDDDEIFKI